jgi:hypothetical protein
MHPAAHTFAGLKDYILTHSRLYRHCLQMSKILSRKFVILYKLCEDLLSNSKHYDWKLRAIKTTLYVAGGMKRSAPELTEDKVGSSAALSAALQCTCQPRLEQIPLRVCTLLLCA